MKRRSFLKGLPVATAAAAMSSAALADPEPVADNEDPWGRADRLAHELVETLSQLEGGRWSVHVYGDGRAMDVLFRTERDRMCSLTGAPRE